LLETMSFFSNDGARRMHEQRPVTTGADRERPSHAAMRGRPLRLDSVIGFDGIGRPGARATEKWPPEGPGWSRSPRVHYCNTFFSVVLSPGLGCCPLSGPGDESPQGGHRFPAASKPRILGDVRAQPAVTRRRSP